VDERDNISKMRKLAISLLAFTFLSLNLDLAVATSGGGWDAMTVRSAPSITGGVYCQTTISTGASVEVTDCTPGTDILCCAIVATQMCNQVVFCNNPFSERVPCDTSFPGTTHMCGYYDGTGSCYDLTRYNGLSSDVKSNTVFFNEPFGTTYCWNPAAANRIKCSDEQFHCRTNVWTGIGECTAESGPTNLDWYYCAAKTQFPHGCNNFGPAGVSLNSGWSGIGAICYDPATNGVGNPACTVHDTTCVTNSLDSKGSCAKIRNSTLDTVGYYCDYADSLCNHIVQCYNPLVSSDGTNKWKTCDANSVGCETINSKEGRCFTPASKDPNAYACTGRTKCNEVNKGGCWDSTIAKIAPMSLGAGYCRTLSDGSGYETAEDCSGYFGCCKIVDDTQCNRVFQCYNGNVTVNCDNSGPNRDYLCGVYT
jgi:hypothetical protein